MIGNKVKMRNYINATEKINDLFSHIMYAKYLKENLNYFENLVIDKKSGKNKTYNEQKQ